MRPTILFYSIATLYVLSASVFIMDIVASTKEDLQQVSQNSVGNNNKLS